jgi:hypothetical protein
MECHRKQVHAELRWSPSEMTVEVSFTLIRRGLGERVASQQNCRSIPGISLVPRIPNVSRWDGNQVGSNVGSAKFDILEAEAEGWITWSSPLGVDMSGIEWRFRECNRAEGGTDERLNLPAS